VSDFRLVVTRIDPNPKYDENAYRIGYNLNDPRGREFDESEVLRVVISDDEFRAIKLALLAEMEPKKDGA
jgi:hypothetical protein